jgi:hypothetical protein
LKLLRREASPLRIPLLEGWIDDGVKGEGSSEIGEGSGCWGAINEFLFDALMMSLYVTVGDGSGCVVGLTGSVTDLSGVDASFSWGGAVEEVVSNAFSIGRLFFRTKLIVLDMFLRNVGVRGVLSGKSSSA